MKKKIFIIIFIIIVPILILCIDHYILKSDLNIDKAYVCSTQWNYIKKHKNEYPRDLLELALRNKETIPFVADYPQKHKQNISMNFQNEINQTSIPLLLQWDERWGYKEYGDNMMAINGCGPTCLSMVLAYLKQNAKYNPYFIAQFAYQNGYYTKEGTAWALMSEGAQTFGLNVKQLPKDESAIQNALENGQPIICSVGPGFFTSKGHFIVLKEYKNKRIYVNDPNSVCNSEKTYTYEEISSQIKNLWAYSL